MISPNHDFARGTRLGSSQSGPISRTLNRESVPVEGYVRVIRNAMAVPSSVPSRSPLPMMKFRPKRAPDQVAAVCYRTGERGIEFLLVKTGGGRWTFPKGGVEAGLTYAQAAALEAYEEAGVHGHMEEAPFASYVGRKRREVRRASNTAELMVHAHLCKVLRRGKPEESNRDPRWFSPEQAKRKLLESRTQQEGAELAKVVERALLRIRELQNQTAGSSRSLVGKDALQKTPFEAAEIRRVFGQVTDTKVTAFRQWSAAQMPPAEVSVITALRRVLQLGPRKD